MKKNTMIIAILMIAVISLCSCSLISGVVSNIEITEMPKTSYSQNESLENVKFGLKMVLSDTTEININIVNKDNEWVIDPQNEFITGTLSVENFSTENVGEFNAKISYAQEGYDTLVVNFEYTVNSTVFAGGTGSENNPYLVETAEQFVLMNGSDKYYELISDITLNGKDTFVASFNGVFNGNGHKIYAGIYTENIQWPALFGTVNNATISNFDFVLEKFALISNFCLGNATSFENINVKQGENIIVAEQNDSFFLYRALGNVTFTNCNNYADLSVGGSGYSALFIGSGVATNYSAKFINCNNYGSIQGVNVSFFIGNAYSTSIQSKNITIENCGNYGSILGTKNVALFNAINKNIYSELESSEAVISNFNNEGEMRTVSCNGLSIAADSNNQLNIAWADNTVSKLVVVIGSYARGNDGTWFLYIEEDIAVTAEDSSYTATNKLGNFVTIADGITAPVSYTNSLQQAGVKYGFNADGQWVFDLSECDSQYADYALNNVKPSVTVYAYNAEGILLGTASC